MRLHIPETESCRRGCVSIELMSPVSCLLLLVLPICTETLFLLNWTPESSFLQPLLRQRRRWLIFHRAWPKFKPYSLNPNCGAQRAQQYLYRISHTFPVLTIAHFRFCSLMLPPIQRLRTSTGASLLLGCISLSCAGTRSRYPQIFWCSFGFGASFVASVQHCGVLFLQRLTASINQGIWI